mmetsp:Transcript_24684/g.79708  ORF Transcript_24684/g.79708 Transcript_24684/m.79708 type:complete len:204 (-) Transcript_24684:3010-3621(-)
MRDRRQGRQLSVRPRRRDSSGCVPACRAAPRPVRPSHPLPRPGGLPRGRYGEALPGHQGRVRQAAALRPGGHRPAVRGGRRVRHRLPAQQLRVPRPRVARAAQQGYLSEGRAAAVGPAGRRVRARGAALRGRWWSRGARAGDGRDAVPGGGGRGGETAAVRRGRGGAAVRGRRRMRHRLPPEQLPVLRPDLLGRARRIHGRRV